MFGLMRKIIHIHTHNTDLKKRLLAYSCREQTDAECGIIFLKNFGFNVVSAAKTVVYR